jgi:hypothetical protein
MLPSAMFIPAHLTFAPDMMREQGAVQEHGKAG